MSTPSRLAQTRFAAVAALDRNLVAQAQMEWNRLPLNSLQAGFQQTFLPAIAPGLRNAQAAAASVAAQTIAEATGRPSTVNPAAFAGHASNGDTLPHALAMPLVELYVDLGNGVDPAQAYQSSFDSMDRMLTTQIHDAARQAESVQMVDHEVTFYIRYTEPGACDRCIVLAGKHYKWNDGFERHDNCRCYHIQYSTVYRDPVGGHQQSGDIVSITNPSPYRTNAQPQNPLALFHSMSTAEQDRVFGHANAQAIRDGADIYQVVNATGSRAGMSTTISGPRGEQYKGTIQGVPRGQVRLVPEAIYQIAGNDQAYARQLLKKNGYIL